MKGVPQMKQKALLIVMAVMFTAACLYPGAAAAAEDDDTFDGDKKAACEALLCLSSGERPDECDGPLKRYYGIRHKKWKDTCKARADFLKLCPNNGESDNQSEKNSDE